MLPNKKEDNTMAARIVVLLSTLKVKYNIISTIGGPKELCRAKGIFLTNCGGNVAGSRTGEARRKDSQPAR